MIENPLLEVAVVLALVWWLLHWLRRSARVVPPRWFMRPVEQPRGFTVLPHVYDWAKDDSDG